LKSWHQPLPSLPPLSKYQENYENIKKSQVTKSEKKRVEEKDM
jgi:hypothetical protein